LRGRLYGFVFLFQWYGPSQLSIGGLVGTPRAVPSI
jgi:hypothetical protein